MPLPRRYVVRVILTPTQETQFDNGFLECLRYAGLVKIHDAASTPQTVFDILPPHGINSKVWADQNSQRMATFGYNAIAAPEMP